MIENLNSRQKKKLSFILEKMISLIVKMRVSDNNWRLQQNETLAYGWFHYLQINDSIEKLDILYKEIMSKYDTQLKEQLCKDEKKDCKRRLLIEKYLETYSRYREK